MSFFFCKKTSLSFVFDIRDTSVSVGVVKLEKDKKPEIILCQKFELNIHDAKNYKKCIASLAKVLDKAVVSLRKELVKIGNKESIDTYYFFIGSPWSVSQSKTIKVIKDKLFEINNSLLKKIIGDEELYIENSLERQVFESDWDVLEEKIIQSKLNGYVIDDIYGKKTQSLTVELFVSFVTKEIKDKLFSFVDSRFGKNMKIQNHSCVISSYSFLRDLHLNKNDYIYIDVGKLITDIYVVKDEIIFAVASFPFGEENIIETSVSKTNLSRDIFMSHISIGQDNKFDLVSHNNGKDILKTGFDEWEEKFKDTLSKICNEMNIPNNLLVISSGMITTMLIKELSNKEKDKKFEHLGSKIEVSIIGEGLINNYISCAKAFANESYLKMDIIFINKIFNK